jgi:undecaprenyl-diphosphatase
VKLDKWVSFSITHWRWLLPSGVAAMLVGIFLKVTEELDEIEAIDRFVHDFVIAHRHGAINAQVVDLSALGSGTVLTLLSLIALLVFTLLGDRRGAFALLVGSIGAVFWTVVLKNLIARPRPSSDRLVEVAGHSYPSGHSLGAAAVYFLLAFLVMRHFQGHWARVSLFFAAAFLVGLIGLSRIYLGVHYLSDVASGLLFGTAWACIVTAVFFVIRSRASKKL